MKIENYKYSIQEAFRNCFYIVPEYQREYVWSDDEVLQILEDIYEQIDNASSEYFIGTILVSPTNTESYRNFYNIIDGQQRLTTIFLILCVLRVFFKETEQGEFINELLRTKRLGNEMKTDLRLEPRYDHADEVIKHLVQANGNPEVVRGGIPSHIPIYGSVEKILAAYDVIYSFFKETYDDQDRLKEYMKYLVNKVVFIQISTDESNALKIFETINERGIRLNPMDLLKNLLFAQVPSDDYENLKNEWKKITGPLEQNKEKPLRFLRYFLMSNYVIENDRKDSIVRENEIYHWSSRNTDLTEYKTEPFVFVRKIVKNVNKYIDFSKGRGNDGTSSNAMASLKYLTGKAFSIHYVLLLAAADLPKRFFDQFIPQLESFVFYYLFTKTPTKELERFFSRWADELRDITCIENQDKQCAELNKFIVDRFNQNMIKKKSELHDTLMRLTLHSMQKYRVKYLLARLAQYVDMEFGGQTERGSLEQYIHKDTHIEHIFPERPRDNLRARWEEKHPDQPYELIKNRLGNLTLLEKPINITVGNNLYDKKKTDYAMSGFYLTRSLSSLADVGQNTSITRINEKLCAFEEWDLEAVEKRQSLLTDLTFDVWEITEIRN